MVSECHPHSWTQASSQPVELEAAGGPGQELEGAFAPLGKFFALLEFQQLNNIIIYTVIIVEGSNFLFSS